MIKFCISSNINYYKKTHPIIVSTLLASGVPANDIYFFIGGSNSFYKIEDFSGINAYVVGHNSMDFTALISVFELNLYSPYWFLLHDTSYVGVDFYKKIIEYDYINKLSVSLTYNKSMNIGAYSWQLLKNKSEALFVFKNRNYSTDGIQFCKKQAVFYEDYFLDKQYYYCTNPRKVGHEKNLLYKTKTNRIIEIFDEIDFYKVKANYDFKEKYEVDL